jgi:pimeloyl-ACP methyl ester carboxylesterase
VPFARSNGFKISFEVSGDGPAVVLHPGMFQDGAHWAYSGYTSALTSAHTVIAVDPLGLGASDAPHQAEDYSLERRVDSVTAVLDAVGVERAAFWGYSLGAMTGYAVAAHAPDRLTCLVAGGFDPIDGFRSAIGPTLRLLGLPADTAREGIANALAAAEGAGSQAQALIRAAQESFVAGWQQAMWAGAVAMTVLFVYVLVRGPRSAA